VNLLNGIPSSVVGFSLSLYDILKKSTCFHVHYYSLCNSDSICDLSAVALSVCVSQNCKELLALAFSVP
jgi:hypothetical protein